MLLKLSKLTGDDSDRRTYFNTSMITEVGTVVGKPDSTLICMADRSRIFVDKPVEEVIESLNKCGWGLFV